MTNQNFTEWIDLFNKTTPAERLEVTLIMLQRIEAREDEVYNLCFNNPKHLYTLPANKLQEVARIANEEAHSFFLAALPNASDMLAALEGLTVFCVADFAGMTTSDLTDAISDIETVWNVSAHVSEETKGKLA